MGVRFLDSQVCRRAIAWSAALTFVIVLGIPVAATALSDSASSAGATANAGADTAQGSPSTAYAAPYTQPVLKLTGPAESMAPRFVPRVPESPLKAGEKGADGVLYQDVVTSSPYANLSLRDCVEFAMDNNLDLRNARRDVDISASSLRESEAFFTPFVDLIGSSTYSETRTDVTNPFTGETERKRITQNRQEGRAEVRQNFASGGNLTVGGGPSRTRGAAGTGSNGGNVAYDNEADARLNQPLLRGRGFDIGTADLRRARLAQMNEEIAYRLRQRDITFAVIQQYFQLLQAAQSMRVSQDALAEKLRFLEETRIKFEKGRVAESEILRAELQYLQEQESAVGRLQTFNDRRERLALTLGLDPNTPLSVQDVSDLLGKRGRYEIPGAQESITLALNARLELLQSEIATETARVNLQVARNNVLPNLDLTTGYSTGDRDDSLGGATDIEDNMWDAGVELRIPLPNIGRREQRRRAELTLEKTRTDWENRERGITQEVLSSHRAVQSAESSLAILARTVEQARKNLELINGSFEVGYSTITEVRLAQDDLFQAQTNYNNTLLNYQIAIARFYTAVGQDLN